MPPDDSVISVRDLRKSYGSVEALKGVSFDVKAGEVFGLLGQNGAGKSTLIKILLGIVRKTDGDAELLNEAAGNSTVRKRVGYLPEDHQFPQYHTAYSLLDFYGQLYGLGANERKKKIPEVLEIVGIAKRMHSKIRTFSKGMKQRLGIAQAFFHDPKVIFLDEPTDGVDPVGRREIRELMEDLKRRGVTVFVNSHLLGEVELICDRVAILQRGELMRIGTVADLTRQENRFVIGLAQGQTFPTAAVAALNLTVEPVGDKWEVVVPDWGMIDRVLPVLSGAGVSVRHLVEKRQTLEDVFVSMVDQADPGTDGRRPAKARPAVARRAN